MVVRTSAANSFELNGVFTANDLYSDHVLIISGEIS